MKKTTALLATLALAMGAFAQGSLTPPGAPTETMKTLEQIEPRTPISAATTITERGSYYLTQNVVVSSGNAIIIGSNDVTLDLNGFTIRSTEATPTSYGIYVFGIRRNIAIANGFIDSGVSFDGSTFSGTGFAYGIYSSSDSGISVSKVSVSGCLHGGIYLYDDDATTVDSCTVQTVGSYGIYAGKVRSSVVQECGGTAIYGRQVDDCRGSAVLNGIGIHGQTVRGSYGFATGSSGISGYTVHNSFGHAFSNVGSAFGINAIVIQNSYGYGGSTASSSYGIIGETVLNCYGSGYCASSGESFGISADTVQNSYGICSGDDRGAGYGIDAVSVGNSRGYGSRISSGSRGIRASGPVENCLAYCNADAAIEAESAVNCCGESYSGYGIDAYKNAVDCVGISSTSIGIYTDNARSCHGSGTTGIFAQSTVDGCRGEGTTLNGIYGLTVHNSCGESESGIGVYGNMVQNSYGTTTSGSYGLRATRSAIGCRGYTVGSGVGISGYILNSCTGSSGSGTPISYSYKYNMP